MNTEKSIDVLNALIEINIDRINGYEIAAKETEETDLKRLFSQFKQTSLKCKAELLNEVYKLGGTPVEEPKMPGEIFSASMNANTISTGDDREEILNSCECSNDFASNTYKDALRNNLEIISAEQKTMLHSQHISIKADYDKLKGLRNLLSEHG